MCPWTNYDLSLSPIWLQMPSFNSVIYFQNYVIDPPMIKYYRANRVSFSIDFSNFFKEFFMR